MNGEFREAVLYDAETNTAFRDALIDRLIVPALGRAIDMNEDSEGRTVLVDEEIQYEDSRAAYDFYAERGSAQITIGVSVFTGLGELSDEAIALIADEIAHSDLSDVMRTNLSDESTLRAATIEFVRHHEFDINLETSSATVWNTIGIAVNGRMIRNVDDDETPVAELDLERQALFEPRELVELFRALHGMELVTDEEVRRFLEAF